MVSQRHIKKQNVSWTLLWIVWKQHNVKMSVTVKKLMKELRAAEVKKKEDGDEGVLIDRLPLREMHQEGWRKLSRSQTHSEKGILILVSSLWLPTSTDSSIKTSVMVGELVARWSFISALIIILAYTVSLWGKESWEWNISRNALVGTGGKTKNNKHQLWQPILF